MKTNPLLRLMLVLLSVLTATQTFAQDKKAPASPPATANGKVGNATVTVVYSSPSVKGRPVWGQLVPYGQVWRAGANDATTITFDQPVTVEGKPLAAGTYSLFTIPTEKQWTMIFNKEAKQWGAYKYDEKKDALRVTVTPQKAITPAEQLIYDVTPTGLTLRWENMTVPVAIK
ncbi:DUF2911 domain-containing protein [Hymenobacter lapidiphilus]|uniref:DUF2911 domain-containing protein n=1 Tax=Hymenobacter sp. CCM 8763 TaxID=2303334 RepID=UPI000E34538E|nr:DUF2911 domain-containing protein [Hymenobacter sp. CCM 8763]RFP64114.1 DUF2911 domain-containing protein [Hymenobacter sp. CCM 8763]